jgi:hypothetical protein
MKTFFLGFVSAILIFPLSAAAFFRLGLADVNGDAPPSATESRWMAAAVHHSIARRATGLEAPPAAGDELLVAGGKLYMNGCAGCHGELGKPFNLRKITASFRGCQNCPISPRHTANRKFIGL